jgi:hypothetical protein
MSEIPVIREFRMLTKFCQLDGIADGPFVQWVVAQMDHLMFEFKI